MTANQRSSKRQLAIWLLATIITVLSLIAHYIGPSKFHFSEETWQKVIEFHQQDEIFKRRPLTTETVVLIVEATGLSYATAFLSFQFLLFFLTGPAFYFFLRRLKFNHRYSLTGMAILLLSLPVFLSQFEPIHTWSDFTVYLLVPLAFGLALRRRVVLPALMIAVATLDRETTLLFLPALFLFSRYAEGDKRWRPVAVVVLTLVVYFLMRWLIVPAGSATPYDCLQFNFENRLRTSDTAFSFLVSLGFIWVVGLRQAIAPVNSKTEALIALRIGAAITVAGIVATTLLYGHARESRLFVPPAIFLIPLTLNYFQQRQSELKRFISLYWPTTGKKVFWLVLGLPVCAAIVKFLFPAFEYRPWPDINRAYLAVHAAIVVFFLLFEFYLWPRRRCRDD